MILERFFTTYFWDDILFTTFFTILFFDTVGIELGLLLERLVFFVFVFSILLGWLVACIFLIC